MEKMPILTDEELLHLKRRRTTKDAYDFTRIEVRNLVLDVAQAQRDLCMKWHKKIVDEIIKEIEDTNEGASWSMRYGNLKTCIEELKQKYLGGKR